MASKSNVEGKFELLKQEYKFSFTKLKEKQIRILSAIADGKSCMGLFPTGYGKSLLFTLPPLISGGFSLVVSPLKSLVADQLRQLDDMGVPAVGVGPDTTAAEKKGIKAGVYKVLMFAPEVLERFDVWRDLIWENPIYVADVRVIAVDEAHLLHSWAETFRPAYNRIVELTSFFTSTPLLLLSATCTDKVREVIVRKLGLDNENLLVEWELPDRPEIYMSVKNEPAMVFSAELGWYLDEVKEKGTHVDKAVVYVSGVSQMSKIVLEVMEYLGEAAYTDAHERIFSLYHAGMDTADLKDILYKFADPASTIRLIICTVAFGIGINIPNIRYIIHWGTCKALDDYWQEVGRAARDGNPSRAIMYATNISLQHASEEMKALVKLDTCLRKFVLDSLSVKKTFKAPSSDCDGQCDSCICSMCNCCSNCRRDCVCRSK